MNSILYIAELNIPNTSAYTQHVLKICDAFAHKNKISLLVFSNKISFMQLKKKYLLKNKFKIKKLSSFKQNTFFSRVKLAFYTKKISSKYNLIITRSPITSLVLSCFKIRNILEVHHPLYGLTKILYEILNFFNLNAHTKFILLHKNLIKIFKNINKKIILDDCVDINDFRFKNKIVKKYEFTYTGSLYDGKGIEIINYLANTFPEKKFHIFGDTNTLSNQYREKIQKQKNIILEGYLDYKNLPLILMQSKNLLMPYLNKVRVNSKYIEVSNYMSPLKLFDYLASGNIIIASNLKVYSHILKNKKNCFLASPNNYIEWKKIISMIIKNKNEYKFIKTNALLTARKYTWKERVEKIIEFNQNKIEK